MTPVSAKRLRRPAAVAIILIIALGAAITAIAYTVNAAHTWLATRQAKNLADRGLEDAIAGRIREALMSCDTALSLDPGQPTALRLKARLLEAGGQPAAAMEVYDRILQQGTATLEDLRRHAIVADAGHYTAAVGSLVRIIEQNGDPAFGSILQANKAVEEGNPEMAAGILRQAVAASDSDEARMMLLELLAANRSLDRDRDEEPALLRRALDNDGPAGLAARVMAATTTLLPPAQRLEAAGNLRNHPLAGEQERLLADTAEADLDPRWTATIADSLLARVKEAPMSARIAAARWLLARDMPQRAYTLLRNDEVLSDADAFRAWLDAGAALGQWDAMTQVLAKPDLPVPRHMALAYAARANRLAGRPAEAERLWTKALADPGSDTEVMIFMHRSGEDGIFDASLPSLLSDHAMAVPHLSDLLPVVMERRDSRRLRRVLGIAATAPALESHPSLRNDIAYLDLLLGAGPELGVLEGLHKASPEDPAAAANLALALLLLDRRDRAAAILAPLDPSTLPPSQRMVAASVLAASGNPGMAVGLAASIPASALSDQEIALMARFLGPVLAGGE